MLSIDRFIFSPSVVKIGQTVMDPEGLIAAISELGALEIAETDATPLNDLIARVSNGSTADDLVEFAGRQCYQSWAKGRAPKQYIENVLSEAHGSVFEHVSINTQISGVSRTMSHELVRHSIGTAISQESQRYVDAKDMRFVVPPLMAERLLFNMFDTEEGWDFEELEKDEDFTLFRRSCSNSHSDYQQLQDRFKARLRAISEDPKIPDSEKPLRNTLILKRATEAARALLPNAAETRMVFTMNLRALRHILLLRATEHADLEINRVMGKMFEACRDFAPHFFADVHPIHNSDGIFIGLSATHGRV